MAVIHETLTLEDRLTATMTQCIQVTQRMATALDTVRDVALNVETATAATAAGIDNLSREMRESTAEIARTSSAGRSLTDTLKGLAGGFTAIQAGRWLVNTSDQLVQIDARLQMMTGSAEAAAAAQEQIYQAAMRSRGAYTDMADLVSKLGTLAPDAFGSMGELVGFAEQLQKQMALSGTSTMAAQAAMLQLTQGLASGTLRGEELNSVLEQTPMIAQTIARYMDVDIGTMRELASEGAITADVVKNAMLGAAEETNAAFAQMPMTWGQMWTAAQNIAIQALEPVLGMINAVANNIDVIGPIVLGVAAAFGVYMAATYGAQAATAAFTAAQAALNAVMSMNPVGLVIIGVVLLISLFYAGVAAVNNFAGTSVSATGIIAGTFLAAFSLIGNVLIFIMNLFSDVGNFVGNVFRDPIGAVKVLFFDLASTVLGLVSNMAHGLESLVNAIPGVEINITGGIDSLYRKAQDAARQAKDESGWVEYFKHQEYIDLTGAYQTGYQAGAGFDPFGAIGDVVGGFSASVPAYDELQSINSSVKGIEKAVSMSEEDIKALADVAQRRYINQVNLTSQTPVINVSGQNTGNTAADRRALAEAIQRILMEQLASGSVRSTAMPY